MGFKYFDDSGNFEIPNQSILSEHVKANRQLFYKTSDNTLALMPLNISSDNAPSHVFVSRAGDGDSYIAVELFVEEEDADRVQEVSAQDIYGPNYIGSDLQLDESSQYLQSGSTGNRPPPIQGPDGDLIKVDTYRSRFGDSATRAQQQPHTPSTSDDEGESEAATATEVPPVRVLEGFEDETTFSALLGRGQIGVSFGEVAVYEDPPDESVEATVADTEYYYFNADSGILEFPPESQLYLAQQRGEPIYYLISDLGSSAGKRLVELSQDNDVHQIGKPQYLYLPQGDNYLRFDMNLPAEDSEEPELISLEDLMKYNRALGREIGDMKSFYVPPAKYFDNNGNINIPQQSKLYVPFQNHEIYFPSNIGGHTKLFPLDEQISKADAPDKVYIAADEDMYLEYNFKNAVSDDLEIPTQKSFDSLVRQYQVEHPLSAPSSMETSHNPNPTMERAAVEQGSAQPLLEQLEDPGPQVVDYQQGNCSRRWHRFKETRGGYSLSKHYLNLAQEGASGRGVLTFTSIWLLTVTFAFVMLGAGKSEEYYSLITTFLTRDVDWSGLDTSDELRLTAGEAPLIAAGVAFFAEQVVESLVNIGNAGVDCKRGPEPQVDM